MSANPYSAQSGAAMSTLRGSSPGSSNNRTRPMSSRQILQEYRHLFAKRSLSLLCAFATTFGSVVAQLSIPIIVGMVIDLIMKLVAHGQNRSFTDIYLYLAALVGCIMINALCLWLQGRIIAKLASSIVFELRSSAHEKIASIPVIDLEARGKGDMIACIVTDADQISDGLLQGLIQLCSGCASVLITLIFMWFIAPGMTLVVIVLTPLSALVTSALARTSSKSFASQQLLQGQLSACAEQRISHRKLLASYAQQPRGRLIFSKLNGELHKAGVHAQFVSSLINPGTRLVNNCMYALLVTLGCLGLCGVIPMSLSLGQLQAFLSYATQYSKPFSEIAGVIGQIQAAWAASARIFSFLSSPEKKLKEADPANISKVAQAALPKKVTEHSAKEIKFEKVSFGYRPDLEVLHSIDLTIPKGASCALVGSTGCGKTTLASLLMAYIRPNSGKILLDGQDIAKLSDAELRREVGMVAQDVWLNSGSIHDIIAYGKTNASRAEVIEAAKRSSAHSFIEALPEGYDTILNSARNQLSQGQRQLISIARMMLSEASVLILDEATSSLDTGTEQAVQRAFAELCKGRTSLVIAHRLSTIRHADMIVVMDKGSIVEMGKHEELLAKQGRYAALLASQYAGQRI